jgi:hypothetical protein
MLTEALHNEKPFLGCSVTEHARRKHRIKKEMGPHLPPDRLGQRTTKTQRKQDCQQKSKSRKRVEHLRLGRTPEVTALLTEDAVAITV